MATTLTNAERQILLGIAGDELAIMERAARLRRVRCAGFTGERRVKHGRELVEADTACQFGPRVDLGRWLGTEATPAIRQAGGRILARLAAAGLIERSAPAGGRQTHARLTAAGRKVVADLLLASAKEA